MGSQQQLSTKSVGRPASSTHLGCSRLSTAGLVHLVGMQTTSPPDAGLGPVLTLAQLGAQLGVSVQTLYDLRSQGRGPRGFRVGRELRFRASEVAAWVAQMEADDAERHPRRPN